MNEYEARIKSFANTVTEIRSASGATPSTLMFALMAIMLAKNKITDRDVEIMFSVEKGQALNTLKSYFDQGYGDPDFEIKNEEELKLAEKYCMGFIDTMSEQVKNTAEQLKSIRKKKTVETEISKPKPEHVEPSKPWPKPSKKKAVTETELSKVEVKKVEKLKTVKKKVAPKDRKPVQVHI